MTETFYDIHMHAMDLSHPNLLAFMERINGLGAKLVLGGLAEPLLGKKEERLLNLLTVMENSIEDYFILLEHFLLAKEPVPDTGGTFTIGDQRFDTILMTPLIMDFGFKQIKTDTFYDMALGKPVVGQTAGILSAIKKYCACQFALQVDDDRQQEGAVVPRTSRPLLEIYPFLGINPLLYREESLEELLTRCFGGYTGKRTDLKANMGKFNGDISSVGSNVFAGIKLYPPLGFDPWPEGNARAMAKVRFLYDLCERQRVPITAHCNDGGFATVDNAEELTDPAKWAKVLKEYPRLKLNLAHMGKQEKFFGLIHPHAWRKKVIELTESYEHVYSDISCLAFDDGFYKDLAEILKEKPFLLDKLLFGSDYMINLQWIDSYNAYLRGFLETGQLRDAEKVRICNGNPGRFLFEM